jgi:hypothetical protein
MRLTALPPPPPTPMTFIFGKSSRTGWISEKFSIFAPFGCYIEIMFDIDLSKN